MILKNQQLTSKTPGRFNDLPKIDPQSDLVSKLQSLTLPRRLVMIRGHYGISRTVMGELLSKSLQQVQRYELGEAHIGPMVRQALINLTGLHEGYFKRQICLDDIKPNLKIVNHLLRYKLEGTRLNVWMDRYYKQGNEQLAADVGFSASYIKLLRLNKCNMSLAAADRISQVAKLPIAVFKNV